MLPTDTRLLRGRTVLEYEVGEYLQGEAYLERLLEVMRLTSPGPTLEYAATAVVIPMVARITGMDDRLDAAERAADIVLSSPSATSIATMLATQGLALVAVLRGSEDSAQQRYGVLESRRGILVNTEGLFPDRLLGLLAHTMGNLDDAAEHFEDALTFCRKAGYRPELAWTCCDYAETLLQRNESGDRTKAIALLDESLTICQELGMRPLMERVVAIGERAESQPANAPAFPDGLTQREVEVIRLIALGKSNREIADELTISLNTVLRHVSHILAKTGSSNRLEAVGYAAREGLVSL